MVQPEAACKTCCFEGSIERPNFAKKSMPRRGVATAVSKKSNLKVWRQNPQAGIGLPLAPTRCGPVRSAVLVWGKIDNDTPESTKNLNCSLYPEGVFLLVGKTWPWLTLVQLQRGDQQGWVGPVAVAVRESTAGLLVFLVWAALLSLRGLGTETGVVETPTVAAGLGGRGVCEQQRPDLSPVGPFPQNEEQERRYPEGGVRSRNGGSCGALFMLWSCQIFLHR